MKMILTAMVLSTLLASCAHQKQCGPELGDKEKREKQVERQTELLEKRNQASPRRP